MRSGTTTAKKKIAILGAGPAGSTLALTLLSAGVDPDDLVMIDKARFPRPKLCGGGITCRGTELMQELVGEPPGGVRTVGLEFRCEVGRFDVRELGPQWLFDRSVLDNALLDACKARGVEVREEENVSALEPGAAGWTLTTGRGAKETYPWVAGADGACGIARRASGLRGGITGRLVEAVYERVDAPAHGEPLRTDRLYFDFDPVLDGIPGYAWIFPYPAPGGGELWKIGVMDGRGRASGEVLRRWTADYAERNGFRIAEDKIHGWPERYYHVSTRGHRPGLVLVGEALGIDALLGEGIAPAMYSAQYAAGRLKQALDAGSQSIRGYERGFLATAEGRNLWFQAQLADMLYGRHPYRWLRVLFEMDHLQTLAGGGTDRYGRLAKHIPGLGFRYAMQVARSGLPSAAPLQRKTGVARMASHA